jgi:hypothetical protein
VLAQQVRLNWDLRIRSTERQVISVHQLAGLIQPEWQGAAGGERAEEVADLFRKLLYEAQQVTLDRLLWHHDGRMALTASVYGAGRRELQAVVTCGLADAIEAERELLRVQAPNPVIEGLTPGKCDAMTRVAAQLYLPAAGSLEGARCFAEFYRERSVAQIKAALRNLYGVTLAPWHANQRIAEPHEELTRLCRARLGLDGGDFPQELQRRVKSIGSQARDLGMGGVSLDDSSLRVQIPKRETRRYPGPFETLAGGGPPLENLAVQVGTTLGALDGDTVLVTADAHAWPTDFGMLAEGPIVGDYAAMEAAIKFRLLEHSDLGDLHDFEHALAGPAQLNDRMDPEALPDAPEKALDVIRQIRSLAATACGHDVRPYYLALLFQAARRIMTAELDVRRSKLELAPLVHACISLGVLAERLSQPAAAMEPPARPDWRLEVAEGTQEVLVNGRPTQRLTTTELRCLRYLLSSAGKLCSRKTVFEATFDEPYADECDERLNMLMSRLRAKIEPDPDHPTFIEVRRGEGFILRPHRR